MYCQKSNAYSVQNNKIQYDKSKLLIHPSSEIPYWRIVKNQAPIQFNGTHTYIHIKRQIVARIIILKGAQSQETKFITQDYNPQYSSRLKSLKLLPILYLFQLKDLVLNLHKNHFSYIQHLVIE